MPDYYNTVKTTGTSVSVPIVHNDSQWIWEIQQVTVMYSNTNDSPNAGILKNNIPAAGAAPLLPGPGLNYPNAGLTQTYAGDPYIYSEARDNVQVVVTQCTPGATVTVFAQYVEYRSSDPAIQQRKVRG